MVALNSSTFFENPHSRARSIASFCTDSTRCKSLDRIDMRFSIYESRVGLESFSRDPIGYEGGSIGLYEYCIAKPLHFVDSTGFRGRVPSDTDFPLGAWTRFDFYNHYVSGNGSPVDLANVGWLPPFIARNRGHVSRHSEQALAEAQSLINCDDGEGSYSLSKRIRVSDLWQQGQNPLYTWSVIGGAPMTINYYVSASWTCSKCCSSEGGLQVTSFSLQVDNHFLMLDAYTNPWNQGPDDPRMVNRRSICFENCRNSFPPAGQRAQYQLCLSKCAKRFPTNDPIDARPYIITARFSDQGQHSEENPCP